jgi:hypothetical protein
MGGACWHSCRSWSSRGGQAKRAVVHADALNVAGRLGPRLRFSASAHCVGPKSAGGAGVSPILASNSAPSSSTASALK